MAIYYIADTTTIVIVIGDEGFVIADQQVIKAITIHVPGGAARDAAISVVQRTANKPEAGGRDQIGQGDRSGKGTAVSEYHRETKTPDHEVIETIAINVADTASPASIIVLNIAGDPETIGAIEAGSIEAGGKSASVPKEHIAHPRGVVTGTGKGCPNDDVSEAIAVHISCFIC